MSDAPHYARLSGLLMAASASLLAQTEPPAVSPPSAGAVSVRDLIGYVPADAIAVVDLHDLRATWGAFGHFAEPLPQDLPATLRVLPLGAKLAIRAATGLSLGALLEAVGPAQVVLAVLPPVRVRGKPRAIAFARVRNAEAVDALVARSIPGLAWARDGGVLVAAADRASLRLARDRLRADPRTGLLARADYVADRPDRPRHGVRAWLDLAAVRRSRLPDAYWRGLDGGGRLTIGPIVAAFDRGTRIDATLRANGERVAVDATVDGSPIGTPSEELLVAGLDGRSLPAVPAGAMGLLALDRGVGAFLGGIERFAPDQAVQTRAGLSMLSILFGGASIDEQVLGAVREPLAMMVLPRDDDALADRTRSALQLPSFVVAADIDQPKAASRLLQRGWANFSLVVAAQRRQQGKAPFRMRGRRLPEGMLRYAEFEDWASVGAAPLEHEFSPGLLVGRETAWVGTTVDGVVRATRAAAPREHVVGDLIRLYGPPIAEWVRANRQTLALDAVLKEGIPLRESAQRLDVAAAIAGALAAVELRFVPAERSARLSMTWTRRRP